MERAKPTMEQTDLSSEKSSELVVGGQLWHCPVPSQEGGGWSPLASGGGGRDTRAAHPASCPPPPASQSRLGRSERGKAFGACAGGWQCEAFASPVLMGAGADGQGTENRGEWL